jgi:ELWxxDGT repeat protein
MRTPLLHKLLILFVVFLSGCTFNANVSALDALTLNSGSDIGTVTPELVATKKIYVDITNVTLSEGSVAIINVAVNPVRDEDTIVNLDLTTSSSSFIRFNPIPTQIIIPAGQTSKSVLLNTIDDSLVQDQEGWSFNITSADGALQADPGTLAITLNDNDGGNIPNAPAAPPMAKLLKEFNPYPSSINSFVFNNKVYYAGSDAGNGTELWISDGTSNGTKLLKDINPGVASSSPSSFFKVPGSSYLFFKAITASEGTELWRTDGTEQGTILLKDLEPGGSSASYYFYVGHAGKLYFEGYTTADGSELYVSDGTPSGTKMLYEDSPGTTGNYGSSMIVHENEVYFSVQDSATFEASIWKTDGTMAGNVQLVTLQSNGNPFYDSINFELSYGGKIYFNHYDSGYELYSTGLTNATTWMLKDIYPGWMSSYATVTAGIVLNSKLFVAYSSDGGTYTNYYLTDGTPAGTVKVTQTHSTGTAFGLINGNLIYRGCETNQCELYSTAGVNNDGVLIKDIYPGNNAGGQPNNSAPAFAAQIGNKIFFTATTAEGTELWVTDGTTAGTVLLKDIYVGAKSSDASSFTVLGSKLYFVAKSSVFGEEIWVSDGTPAGTVVYKDLMPGAKGSGPKNLKAVNGTHLFFTAYNNISGFGNVFISEVASNSTTGFAHALVESMNSETKSFTELGGLVYFDAMEGNSGNAFWVTDGTSANTVKIKDLYPNITCSDITQLSTFNSSLFFVASTEANGSELHISNGTAAGTSIVKELGTGDASGYIGTLVPTDFGKIIFSSGGSTTYGTEAYATDGTSAGTVMLGDLTSGTASSLIQHVTLIPGQNKVLFFNGGGGSARYYITDGTPAGTTLLTGYSSITTTASTPIALPNGTGAFLFNQDSGNYKGKIYFYKSSDNTVTLLNTGWNTTQQVGAAFYNPTLNLLFFCTSNATSTTLNLWKSDGTVAGTTLLKNIPMTGNNFQITHHTAIGSKTIFQYTNNTTTPVKQLWVTDGTAAGTMQFDSNDGANGSYSVGKEFGGTYYFGRGDASTGLELWKTDGTSGGTVMIKDIRSGSGTSSISNYLVYNGKLYFTADDGINGVELWRTNGTLLGTELVNDINPGSNSSSPTLLKVVAGKLYFTANKVLSGKEVWVYSE